jgi:hypothetical protein
MKFFKFFEYAYLAFAAFFIFEGISNWGRSPSRAWLFFGLALVAVFMFFFKRRFRKKMERRNNP